MKLFTGCILLYCMFIVSCSSTGLYKCEADFKDMGYNTLVLYVYDVTSIDSNNKIIKHDTLGLFCYNVPMRSNKEQLSTQWQVLTKDGYGKYDYADYDNSFSGLNISDTFLYIHPPRFAFYTVLQFCPHPFFQRPCIKGEKWTWDLDIGNSWAIDSLYPLEKVETFHNEYTFVDTCTISSDLGRFFCYKILATGNSVYGESQAAYLLNNKYGIVYSKLITTNKMTFEFYLKAKISNFDSALFNSRVLSSVNYFKSKKVHGLQWN